MILINLSFGNDGQIWSLFKRGVTEVLCSKLDYFESMGVLKLSIQALTNLITEQPKILEKLLEENRQYKLADMYDKMASDTELQNEIVFFMHTCLVTDSCDLTRSETLPCAQVICKALI